MSRTRGLSFLSDQRVCISFGTESGPHSVIRSASTVLTKLSRSIRRARRPSWLRRARIARPTSSRAAWPTSKLAQTQLYSPLELSSSARACRIDVLPVCRGACRTKYFSLNEPQDLHQAHTFQRRDAVVLRGVDGPFGVEVFRAHPKYGRRPARMASRECALRRQPTCRTLLAMGTDRTVG